MAMTTAIVPAEEQAQHDWLTLVARTVARDANVTQEELPLVAKVCDLLGLDPFAKQIHIVRYTRNGPLTFQVSLDGWLLKAAETGQYDGMEPIMYCADDGAWRDTWFSSSPPASAKATVYRKDSSRPITAIANFNSSKREVVYEGQRRLRQNWQDMPDLMLGAAALRQALRRGFPEAFSKLERTLVSLRSEGVAFADESGAIIEAEVHEVPAEDVAGPEQHNEDPAPAAGIGIERAASLQGSIVKYGFTLEQISEELTSREWPAIEELTQQQATLLNSFFFEKAKVR